MGSARKGAIDPGMGSNLQDLRRNLPFLPGPWQAFSKILAHEFGDEQKYLFIFEIVVLRV
jgi:hypothetical protein